MQIKIIRLLRTEESIAVNELAARVSRTQRQPCEVYDSQTWTRAIADYAREDARQKGVLDRLIRELSEILGKCVDEKTHLTLEELATWHLLRDDVDIKQDALRPHIQSRYEAVLARVAEDQPFAVRDALPSAQPSKSSRPKPSEDKEKILQRLADGEKVTAIADEYGVTHQAISKIRTEAKEGKTLPNFAFSVKK